MLLTPFETLITILAVTAGAMITRFSPFLLFPEKKEPPMIVTYLGGVLPPAMMGLLVVYCLKNVNLLQSPFGVPEFVSIAIIVILHKWKNNVLLSIVGGTILYMVVVNFLAC